MIKLATALIGTVMSIGWVIHGAPILFLGVIAFGWGIAPAVVDMMKQYGEPTPDLAPDLTNNTKG